MENIRRYFKRTDKTYLLLCIFSSVMAVTALSSWAAKQGNGFAVDEITGQITGLGDYRRAAVQAGAALIGLVIAVLLSNIDYRSLVKVWPVHVALTWGMVLPTLVLRNVSIGPLTIGYNAGDTDNYSWYKLGGFTLQPTELAKISFILTFAMHLNNVRTRLNEPKELGKLLLHLAVPILIIHVQGDDGTAIIYAIIGCCMMFAAGLSWIGNAAGFVGCCVVLGVLFALVIKTFLTGARSEDLLGTFICAGIGGALLAQIAVNVGMNLRVLPVIGVTLPFYSAGGSSVLMLYICVGLVLSVYTHNTKKLFG